MLMANAVQNLAAQTPGKEAIAIEAFAKALRQVSTMSSCSYVTLFYLPYTLLHTVLAMPLTCNYCI